MTYYQVYVFDGTKEVKMFKPFKTKLAAAQKAIYKLNQPFVIKPIEQ